MAEISLRNIGGHDRKGLRAAAHLAARAFDDEPLTMFLFPRSRSRRRSLRWGLRADLIDIAIHGQLLGAYDGNTLVGVGSWLPPGKFKTTTMRRLHQSRWLGAVALTAPGCIIRGAKIQVAFEKAHPKELHWYLAILAVEPSRHGEGIGRLVLEEKLRDVDAQGLPVYLETTTTKNVAWYYSSGFISRCELITVPGAPPATLLWREPRVH